MKGRNLIIASLSACLLTIGGAAGADSQLLKPNGGSFGIRPGFSVAGVFSGVVSGTVLIGDESVEITPRTKIWRIGAGEMEEGDLVTSCGVIASGYKRGDKLFATLVVISKPDTGNDFSESTLPNAVLKPGTPR